MNEEKSTPKEFIELLKLYSDSEIVEMINYAIKDYGVGYPLVIITFNDLLAEMKIRGIDCTHVNNYEGYLNEIVVELKVMKGKKRLFANWMMLMNDEDFYKSINDDDCDEDGESESLT